MAKSKYRYVILFGPPGVGKGAQASILSRWASFVHVSTGDLIREEIDKRSPVGLRLKDAVDRGEFADDETVLEMILERIDLPEYQNGFVMDGFPRNLNQARRLDEMLAARDKEIECALFLEAPEQVILDRLAGRRICSQCGATYHEQFKRPRIDAICDVCQGAVVRRHDDSSEVHRARLQVYREETAPLEDYYGEQEKLCRVDADQSIQEVAADIRKLLSDDGR